MFVMLINVFAVFLQSALTGKWSSTFLLIVGQKCWSPTKVRFFVILCLSRLSFLELACKAYLPSVGLQQYVLLEL